VTDPALKHFADLMSEYEEDTYPGSRQRRREPSRRLERAKRDVEWDRDPMILVVNGERREFYGIGALAMALDRRPVTIRKWESRGWIPKARFQKRSDSVRGQRRLYTRAQIEGIVRIAAEEGVLGAERPSFADGVFTARVIDLFST
jgi:hypothetical protein